MRETPSTKTYVTDGESRLLETAGGKLAVTTIPWPVTGDRVFLGGETITYTDYVDGLLKAGRALKDEHEVPWLVLNHEPPGGTPLAAGYLAPEADFARRLLESTQPDFSLHGHIHQAPTVKGGFWIWQLGKTVCFNAGQSAPGERPQVILLAWYGPGNWNATWSGAGRVLHAGTRPPSP
jgi:hypothetical protein